MKELNTLTDLLSYIDNLTISKNDINTIKDLIKNCDDTLFYKIIEEIKNSEYDNDLSFSDFSRVILYDNLNNLLESQETITTQINMINEYNKLHSYIIDNNITITNPVATNAEKKNIVYSLVKAKTNDVLTDFYRTNIVNDIIKNDNNVDNILLSSTEYKIPFDYSQIKLNNFDIQYMNANKLTEDDIKKIKSLYLWRATYVK